jgi:hypothetical protein
VCARAVKQNEDLSLYPRKGIGLDLAETSVKDAGIQAETTDNQSFTIPESYFMGLLTLHSYTSRIIAFSFWHFVTIQASNDSAR